MLISPAVPVINALKTSSFFMDGVIGVRLKLLEMGHWDLKVLTGLYLAEGNEGDTIEGLVT